MYRTFLAAAAALAIVGSARADDEKKGDKLPKAVAAAVKSTFPGGRVAGVEKEQEDGKTLYEVKLRYEAGMLEAVLTPKGQVVKVKLKGGEDGEKASKRREEGEEKKGKGEREGGKKAKKGEDNDEHEHKGKKKDKDD
jgi:hypothetical protein